MLISVDAIANLVVLPKGGWTNGSQLRAFFQSDVPPHGTMGGDNGRDCQESANSTNSPRAAGLSALGDFGEL